MLDKETGKVLLEPQTRKPREYKCSISSGARDRHRPDLDPALAFAGTREIRSHHVGPLPFATKAARSSGAIRMAELTRVCRSSFRSQAR